MTWNLVALRQRRRLPGKCLPIPALPITSGEVHVAVRLSLPTPSLSNLTLPTRFVPVLVIHDADV